MPANPRTLALEQLYLRDQRELQRRIAQAVAGQWDAVTDSDLRASLNRFITAATALVAAGQTRAQAATAAYVRTVAQLEDGRTLPARGTAPGVAGRTVDGRPLREVVAVVAPVVFLAIKGGRSVDQALRFGRASASRTAVTQVADAARQEVAWQGAESRGSLSGWQWVVDSAGGCAACLASANNDVHDWSELMESHPWCSCVRTPVVAGAPDTAPRPTGDEIFASMTPAQQQDTFHDDGAAKADAVAAGKVTLDDLTQRTEYHDWRATLSERALPDASDD